MFSSLKSIFSRGKINRGFYEGGKRTGNNQDFWNANSDFENTASPDRDTMRARARWLHENNAIMANIDATIVRNSVGNGFTFQSKTGKENIDKQIEALWAEFIKPKNCDVTRRQHFGDMQSLILSQRMCDGEIVIKKHLTGKKSNPFQIQLVEADRFDVSYKVRVDNSNVLSSVDGIELDTFGAPQNYVFRDGLMSSVKVPADQVIHYFRMDNRATQYRGLSEYKQAIVDLRNFAGYQTSTLKSARARASVAYAIETPNVQGHIGGLLNNTKNDTPDPIYDINGVMVHYLNSGEKMHQYDPTIKGTEYGEFVRSCVRLIAVARKVSYELAFRDYSQVNFSSARASFIQDHKRFNNEQWHLATYVLNPLFEDFLDANVMAGNIKGLGVTAYFLNKSEFCQPRWIAPAREWVDPLKDINAIQKEYDMGLTNLSDIAAARGKVLEDVVADRVKENKMLKDAGILTKEEANA